jgi:sialic acid synthase SpsE
MIEKAMGNSQISPTVSEQESRKGFRLSCQAKIDLNAGTVLQREHISYHRPGTGIPPKLASAIIGLSVKQDIPSGHVLRWEDFHG